MPKVSVAAKGTAPDSSDYIAYKRKQAIFNGKLATQITPRHPDNKGDKALSHEFHLQKGFESGIIEVKLSNPTTQDMLRFKH